MHIRRGSAEVMIYRVKHSRTSSGWMYSVAWYEARGVRKQIQRAKLEDAINEAELKADLLSGGEPEAAGITKADLRELQSARELSRETGLLPALNEWRQGRQLCKGSIIPACQSWAEKIQPSFTSVTVGEAAKEFLAMKKKSGIQVYRGPAATLKHFVPDHENLQLSAIQTQRLNFWLGRWSNAFTRNTHRKRLVTFWRWARRNGYLPSDALTAAEQTERVREEAPLVEVLTPQTFRALLDLIRDRHPHYLPALVLAGFCGLRRIEVHGQKWEDILIDRGLVRITAAKRGTPARRLVPLCSTAAEWLAEVREKKGSIRTGKTWQIDRIRDIGRTAGLELPENGFRNSFISYRVALTGNVDETALEAGNSRTIIFRHYRELVSKPEAEAWFAISPGADRSS